MQNTSYNSDLDVDYVGRGRPLFWLALKTLLLTLVTLGIYRFWMKTRIRQYYWSSVQPGGVPMEYTGTGLEKLLGFLIAVVILAIYLGLVNLGLSFVGLAFFQGNPLALNISFLAVIPLIFFARYRGRRYILARTRWRGVRFGAEKAAFKYMLAALGHSILSIISLGFLVPRQTFKLEKFVTDRTWYGDVKFEQGGDWKMLFKPWLWVPLAVAVTVGALIALGTTENTQFVALILIGYVSMLLAFVHYSVQSFKILAENKRVAQNITVSCDVSSGRVMWIYLVGLILSILAFIGLVFVLGAIGWFVGSGMEFFDLSFSGFGDALSAAEGSILALAYVVFAYFLVLLTLSALSHLLFIQPVLRHYVRRTMFHNVDELDSVSQRAHDENVDAEGFADALDVGAAI